MPKTYKAKKYHYLYKTTNLVNGRYYFGMHSTNDLNDGYVGSGTLLRRAILKYGVENFEKEIIAFCSSRDELAEQEHELIESYLGKQDCMNLKPGGRGGFCNESHAKKFHAAGGVATNRKRGQIHIHRLKTEPEYAEMWHRRLRESNTKPFLGKKHSEETKKRMSEAHKGRGVGEKNSQYGTCWITNGLESRKIERGAEIPEGWKIGRRIVHE